MLDSAARDIVRSTAPVLKDAGVSLMQHFYNRLLTHQPEMKMLFNETHLGNIEQQTALARAAAAYAEHIDDPSVLEGALRHIANKHASLNVRPEHYPIIGEHLLASIREVLGSAASDELINAWAAAYGELADALIGLEAGLYEQALHKSGGFTGWRRFGIGKKEEEGEGVVSLYLYPVDGGKVPAFKPGQYISVRGLDSNWDQLPPRQYSLSKAPNEHYLRITVKREDGAHNHPGGKASSLLVAHMMRGDEVEISIPSGDCVLDEGSGPVVLVGGGIGLTPLVCMMEAASAQGREVLFLYGCRHGGAHPLKHATAKLCAEHPATTQQIIYYEAPHEDDQQGRDYDYVGRIDLAESGALALAGAHYYLCGPIPFLREHYATLIRHGVDPARIHHEVFGPDLMAA